MRCTISALATKALRASRLAKGEKGTSMAGIWTVPSASTGSVAKGATAGFWLGTSLSGEAWPALGMQQSASAAAAMRG